MGGGNARKKETLKKRIIFEINGNNSFSEHLLQFLKNDVNAI